MRPAFSFFATRRFLPLFGTQFLGAFNDNLLKTAITVMITYQGLAMAGIAPAQLVMAASGIFVLPFFLFSATAGKLSESLDKARIARYVKLAEIAIMLVASAGFATRSAAILLFSLFLMGTHSAFFGPLKYSVLPQYLSEDELVEGNGLIEMGTFLAILLGQIGGSLMTGGDVRVAEAALLATAAAGWLFSRRMPSAPPTAARLALSWNVVRDTRELLRHAWAIPEVRSAIRGISWFWLMGVIYTSQLTTFAAEQLGGTVEVFTLLLTLFSVGIGLGSIVCARLSHGHLRLELIMAGSLGMSVFGADLALSAWTRHTGPLLPLAALIGQPALWRTLADVTLLGLFGGFFTVPLYTWLQTASPESFRSRAIAANNIVNGFYMIAATILSTALLSQVRSVAVLFLCVAALNLVATAHLWLSSARLRGLALSWLGR
ncbi:MFS transporter [Paludibacterium paludis]|uniref:MFS transporter n=1 Tax=Paludibacterium paludis TaxID=1225769 RepID=UPI001675C563|nr:MFS transporter [Paludibacterium paludis]